MSNRLTIKFTKFENLDSMGNVESADYGYRIYDDYGISYNNVYDNFEDLSNDVNTDNIIDIIDSHSDVFGDVNSIPCVILNGEYIELDELIKQKERKEKLEMILAN